MGFQIDMSPLERSSRYIGQSLANAGQSIGGALVNSQSMTQQAQQQQDSEEQVKDLVQRAMNGDPQAFQELTAKSPPTARMVAEQLQGQQETQRQDEMDFNSERSIKTAKFVEQMYRAPKEQQAEMFELGLGDDSIDLDEGDRILSQDKKAQEDLITRAALETMEPKAAEIYLDRFFGGGGNSFDVQSSKILEDGSIVAISNDGARQVTSATGEIIEGEDAAKAIRNSNKLSHQRKIEIKRLDQTIKKAQLDDKLLNDQQKGIQRSNIQRLSTLSNTSSGRGSAIQKANKFKGALASGKVFSGAGRKAAAFVPGVFTTQGQFDEEFNAFSEVAARQQLKASGETRPTDADVQGMKQAMFGIGRDEAVNVQLLEDFISDQIEQNKELDQLIEAGKSGDLSNFTYLPNTNLEQKEKQEPNQNKQALQWAKENPNDPRSAQIMQKLQGAK